MNEPLDELYLRWLYSLVGNIKLRKKSTTYWDLLRQLYTKEFVWFIPNDDNRLEDGRYLRYEFVETHDLDQVDPEWLSLGCSMLELLVGIARRLNFEDDGPVDDWFWRMITNLGLKECTDSSRHNEQVVDEILDAVIWRTYRWDGQGGLFPLDRPDQDQREVEIWYQLSAYLLENA